jgi:hypothetical protein
VARAGDAAAQRTSKTENRSRKEPLEAGERILIVNLGRFAVELLALKTSDSRKA